MTEEEYLIEKITHADDNLKKKCLQYSKYLSMGNGFSVGALITLCFISDIFSIVASIFIVCASIITSIITVKLCEMYNEIRQLNSKIIVKLNNKQEVN